MIIKKSIDIFVSMGGLILFSPLLLILLFIIWFEDRRSPFYIAERVGKRGVLFKMVKLRSMIVNADLSGVDSTGGNDSRITNIGHFIRRYKLDEIVQLWNVLTGDMSLVGPRPNVLRDVALYTSEEMLLFSVQPGITDISSIVFSDESDILKDKENPDIAYNQLIRPGKSELGIFYVNNKSTLIDVCIILITVVSIFSRKNSLYLLQILMQKLNATSHLCEVVSRKNKLIPRPPPGSQQIPEDRITNYN